MAITAHFLLKKQGQLTMHTRLLAFHHLPGSHTGENMANAVYNILKAANILTKVFLLSFHLYLFTYLDCRLDGGHLTMHPTTTHS